MHRIARFSCFTAVALATAVQAQSVISARSGTIHYVEGKVLLNDQEISPKFGEFPGMENGAVLKTTGEGRVEVLLSPGAILRVGESSTIRMVANSLVDTRVELQTGKAVLECAEILKGNNVTLLVGGKSVSFATNGIYEATAEPPAVRVYKGEATVLTGEKLLIVKKGHEALLGDVVTAEKFDDNATDDLYNWSSRRSGYLALANVSAASSMNNGYGGYGYGYTNGGWLWNPWMGMFTMVPMDGMLWSPFGYGFYSPYNVGWAYPYYSGGTYYGGTGSSTSSGRPVTSSMSYGGTGVSSGRLGSAASSGSSGSSGSNGGGRSLGGSIGGGGTSGGSAGHGR